MGTGFAPLQVAQPNFTGPHAIACCDSVRKQNVGRPVGNLLCFAFAGTIGRASPCPGCFVSGVPIFLSPARTTRFGLWSCDHQDRIVFRTTLSVVYLTTSEVLCFQENSFCGLLDQQRNPFRVFIHLPVFSDTFQVPVSALTARVFIFTGPPELYGATGHVDDN